ncbi:MULTISPECIES: tetratricopeptide repeat-containing sensor histidine kinase [Winogradskyella]|uniref:tetratricopeptide repeat-containing sensor histidine kinase n=1 Tax=Winogradskyella TaxID=286104 RepID=UPI0015C958B4|nr:MULTISPECIES: tetratricopeptide repeat-containing sensor histidine kinase [Winogradskyella]QXP77487.1 two-component sensor histidine kinase [Winogradskyella sp. HaHa_3_26]
MLKHIFFIFFIIQIATDVIYAQSKVVDSVNALILKSKDDTYSLGERFKYASTASELAKKAKIDSMVLKANRSLSTQYFYLQEYDKYVSLNRANLDLAKKINDSSAVTVAGSNLGSYYRYTQQNDSSYFFYSRALKFYSSKEVSEKKANALFYSADLQQMAKIYTAAEDDAVKALSILNRLPKTEYRLDMYWSLYNLLAMNSNELENYNKAIEYYDESIKYAKVMQNGFINEIYSINNKANVYRKIGKYKEAIDLYESLLPLKLKYEDEDPTFYAVLLSNIIKTKFESDKYDFEDLESDYKEAYEIVESLDDEITLMHLSLDLSEFYLKNQYNDSVVKYSENALNMARKVGSNQTRLQALLNMSKAVDGYKARALLLEHIQLSDSLRSEDRKVRNKFARIKFDTEQIEAENKQISKENLYLLILSVGILLTAVLVYIVISQRAKNRKLELMQIQQTANEDIYNLMLGQQDKVDEARAKEKLRISKELHDGVLGRLFGVRLSLDSINFKEGKEAMLSRSKYISQLQVVEQDIRKISHELNIDFISGSSFIDIVSELIEVQSTAYGLESEFDYTDDISWDLVSNKIKINIYRIIQESMQNIYKHAKAKHIQISILLEKNLICLNIIDDGEGFDILKSKKGIGLKNMNSRVDDIQGHIVFTSKLGNGTSVNVKIPYSN